MTVHRLHGSPLVQAVSLTSRSGHKITFIASIVLLALLVRWGVAQHGYSGEGRPPLHGDFEAQRHWMEVTYHLPIGDWYRATPDNDLFYWGLDYPPLTAYVSYAFGYLAHHYVDPSFVALHASRGMESASLKLFMRWTVLVSDVLVYFAATGLFALVVSQRHHAGKELAVALLVLLLFQPSLILVDHGHFQYNAVMLGLTLAAIALVYRDAESTRVVDPQRIAGAVLFCLALLFKQMALYYALPFFFYLLGCAYKSARTVSTAHAIKRLAVLGVTVLATFAVCLAPFGIEGSRDVLVRVFPVGRGLFEDKVANFWCAASVVYKFRNAFSSGALLSMSGVLTLLGMCFFLVSFQVHEKSILLPLLPLVLVTPQYVAWGLWWMQIALFSLFPLLRRDQLVVAYVAVTMVWTAVRFAVRVQDTRPWWVRRMMQASYAFIAVWHAMEATVPPPVGLPDIYVLANCVFCWACFSWAWLYFLRAQMVYDDGPTKRD